MNKCVYVVEFNLAENYRAMEVQELIMMLLLYVTVWFCFYDKSGVEEELYTYYKG